MPARVRRTLSYRWVCLGLLFFSGLLAFAIRLAPAVATPDLRAEFALDAAALGLLTSLYLWPFALMQPVAGMLTDAIGPRRTVTTFLMIAAAGQLLFALAPVRFGRDSPAAHGLPSLAEFDGGSPPGVPMPAMPFRTSVGVVARSPNLWLLGGYACLLFGGCVSGRLLVVSGLHRS